MFYAGIYDKNIVTWLTQNENRTIAELLVREQRIELHFGLAESGAIASINQKDDSVYGWEVIFPNLEKVWSL